MAGEAADGDAVNGEDEGGAVAEDGPDGLAHEAEVE